MNTTVPIIDVLEVCELLDGMKLYLLYTDIDFDRMNIGKKVKDGYLVEELNEWELEDFILEEYLMLTDSKSVAIKFNYLAVI